MFILETFWNEHVELRCKQLLVPDLSVINYLNCHQNISLTLQKTIRVWKYSSAVIEYIFVKLILFYYDISL